MSISIVDKFNNLSIRDQEEFSPSIKFYESLRELDEIVGLAPEVFDAFYHIFIDETSVEALSVDEKRQKFANRFTNYLALETGRSPVLDRSCFYQNSIPKVQKTLDLVHYFCLRIFDQIFKVRTKPHLEWVDVLFDNKKISYTQAALIPELVQKAALSLTEHNYDESEFVLLLQNRPHKELTAQFAKELIALKAKFPLKDAEIVLFIEVANALFYIKGNADQRELFREFLERVVEGLERSNAEIKNCRNQLEPLSKEKSKEEDPETALMMREVPRIKLEANRYWFLRKFDEIMQCRSKYAKCIDEFYDQGYLTFSVANSFLGLSLMNREWSRFNFTQQLLKLQERYRLEIDITILLDAAFAPLSPTR